MKTFLNLLKKAGLLIIACVLVYSLTTSIHAADRTSPPTVTSLTGPTSGTIGNTYTWSASVTSASGNEIVNVALHETTDADTTFGDVSLGTVSAAAGTSCTDYSCTITKSFTPSTAGTYYIYILTSFTNGGGTTSCNTHPSASETNCLDSRGVYKTFVVSETPTVTSITGPTSGVLGGTYTFTTVVSSTSSYNINVVNFLSLKTIVATLGNRSAGAANCTTTSCTLSSNFTPSEVGTYIIYVGVNYDDSGDDVVCVTRPVSAPYEYCQSSSSKYISFVVTAGGQGGGDDLPNTGILSNQTKNIYIGLGFIFLGILSTQLFRITEIVHTLHERNTSKKSEKRKSKFEQKF